MHKNKIQLFRSYHRVSITAIVLMIAMLLAPTMVLGQYSGPEFCLNCHTKSHEIRYSEWLASGHRFGLMTSEDARKRALPLPGGYRWDDISYVIGGRSGRTLYLDSDGYIITSIEDDLGRDQDGSNQYNNQTGEWTDYRAGEPNVPFDCGSCHTTNHMESGNEGGLPGMIGTFDAPGVECEQCHGNGMTMEKDTSSAACGVCHTRGDDSSVIPASNGFVLNNGQYNELLSSPHNNVSCSTCHNPHKLAAFSIETDCLACHSGRVEDSYLEHSMADYGVTCNDCHMPKATLFEPTGESVKGDVKTHLFYINTDADASMFNEAGDFVKQDFEVPGKPSRVNKAAVTLDFACQGCHATADINELARHAKNFHGRDATKAELEYIGMNPGLTGNWWGGADKNGEGFFLEVANSEGVLTIVFSFYTYDSAGNQIWLIAKGPANTGMTATLEVFITTGREWGETANQADFSIPFGTADFNIPACDVGMFTLTPNATYMDLGFMEIGYDLSRDIMTSLIACPTFVNNAN